MEQGTASSVVEKNVHGDRTVKDKIRSDGTLSREAKAHIM